MTPKQRAILDYFHQHQAEHGVWPTYQEVADSFGVSKGTVFDAVEALIRKGYLIRGLGRKARNIYPANRCPTCGRPIDHGGTA